MEITMEKITDTIFLINGKNKGRFPFCHCLYIKDDICAVIDTACGDENLKPVLGRADIVINSHFHPDHVRGNGLFPQAHIRCHQADKDGLLTFGGMLRYTGYDSFSDEQLSRTMALVVHRPSRVDSTFLDGDILDFGRTKLQVIHTPGHTPGHCCFYEEKTGLMFGGDIDLTPFGPWYGHTCSELELFEKSMELVRKILPAVFVSGHEESVIKENVLVRLNDYIAHFQHRQSQLLQELKTPHTLKELAEKRIIYPRHPQPGFLFNYFETIIIQKHLELMEKRELIQQHSGIYRLK
jgi:glyoxylase-like metal-dependent hydrolase (beta-lactamase superfamily II)